MERKDLDSITVADIESWLDSFDKPGAARKAWAVFRAILRLAFRRGMTDNDVTRRKSDSPAYVTMSRECCRRRRCASC